MSDSEGGVPVEVDDVDTSPVATPGEILVVDDVPANLIALEAALAPLRRNIVAAGSGEEALARLLERDFALLLLDVNMPGMDGFETARLVRSRERTQHLPIIFLTAHAHDQALRAYQLGAVDFLTKPFVPEVLLAKASVFVALHERTEQLAIARMERQFETRQREYETAALRRERDREQEAKNALARANDALAEANDALEQADHRKDTFIAILAHELRNPLAPIRSCIDLIKEDRTRPLTDKMVEILDRQAGVLARLVDDLLDLSRIKRDKVELRPDRVDLVDLVEAAISTSRPTIDERGHSLVFDAPSERIATVADVVRVVQVLCNLLNNAARYTPRGGRIEVACGRADDGAFVRVRDNGIGIPRELQATIFDMFVQERVQSDGSGGLGLGLALAKRLVEMHHGTITVESDGRGHGTSFEVRLPRADSPDSLIVRTRTRDFPDVVPASRPMKTVVVDDNQDALELLRALLEANGMEVVPASDGPSAVSLIREHQPDAAVVDLGLPGLDGYGVVERLRSECPDLKTRFIALTGYGDPADRERAKRAGFHCHLVKPATVEALLACLRSDKPS